MKRYTFHTLKLFLKNMQNNTDTSSLIQNNTHTHKNSWVIKPNKQNDLDRFSSEIKETNNLFEEIISFCKDIIIIILIVFVIRSFLITPFQIEGNSMEDNYHGKEIIIVDVFSYLNFNHYFDDYLENPNNSFVNSIFGVLKKIPIHISDPKRWDVVVIKPHIDDTEKMYYLKRIIWLPWETIKIENGKVSIKKAESDHFITLNELYLSATNIGNTFLPSNVSQTEFLIPKDSYWVMWDNRLISADSRWCFLDCSRKNSTHFLPRKDIVWKVLLDLGYFNIFKEDAFPKLGTFSWIHKPRFLDTPRSATYPELE